MNIKISLKNPDGAYADPETGQGFSGKDPIDVKLTRFICGLIYRGEAKIYETTETLLESGEVALKDMTYPKLKDYAESLGYEFHRGVKKEELIDWIKKAKNQPEIEDDKAEALPSIGEEENESQEKKEGEDT